MALLCEGRKWQKRKTNAAEKAIKKVLFVVSVARKNYYRLL